jgi:hypothetical protein
MQNVMAAWADAELHNLGSAAYQPGYKAATIAELLGLFWMPQGPGSALSSIISQSWQAAADAAASAGITEAALVRALSSGSYFWFQGQLYVQIGSVIFSIGTKAGKISIASKSIQISFGSKSMQALLGTKDMQFKLN